MEIISLILNIVLSGSTIGTVIFFTSKRRKAAAEASCAEIGAKEQEFSLQKDNIEFLANQLQDAWAEVEKMQNLLNESRNQIVELITKTKKLEIEILESDNKRKKAELMTCRNENCNSRVSSAA